MLLLKRDCNMLTNKGLRFNLVNSYCINQLGEGIEVCEVNFDVASANSRQLSTLRRIHHGRTGKEEITLKEKTENI